jgi:hypothetical protein
MCCSVIQILLHLMCFSVIKILLHHRILQVIGVCHVLMTAVFLVIKFFYGHLIDFGFFFQSVSSQGNGMMLLIVEIHLGLFLLLVWYRVEDLNSVGESSAELLYIKATDQDRQQRYTHQQKKTTIVGSSVDGYLPYEATFSRLCLTKRHSHDSFGLVGGTEQEHGGVGRQRRQAGM